MKKLTRWAIALTCVAAAIPAFSAEYKVLHDFGGTGDGELPVGPVAVGNGGVLYGTTQYGGNGPSCAYEIQGCGTVYSLTPPGSPGETWTETVLYSFTGGADGGVVDAGLTIGDNGVIYGATSIGGDAACTSQGTVGCGVVFALAPPASPGDAWTETVLYTFTGGRDGAFPNSVTLDKNGAIYGTAWGGGSSSCKWYIPSPGCGTVYSLTPPSSPGCAWSFQLLIEFNGASGPSNPAAGLLISGGVLYGTSYNGGDLRFYGGLGTVFVVTPPLTKNDPWTVTVVHSFEGAEGDGANPSGAVVMGSGGVLYGTTQNGGSGECSATGVGGCGTVFSLSPSVSPPWNEALLYSFNTFGNCSNGSTVYAGVTMASNGVLYGTTDCGSEKSPGGQVYSLTPPTSGAVWGEAVLHDFVDVKRGDVSYANVVIGKDGVLYGTTYNGGTNGVGTVFSLKP